MHLGLGGSCQENILFLLGRYELKDVAIVNKPVKPPIVRVGDGCIKQESGVSRTEGTKVNNIDWIA